MIYEENDPVSIEYKRLAPKYDRKWAYYVEATVRETLRRMPLQPGDKVLDVACGTGVLLQALSLLDVQVALVGIDLSLEMLEIAASRVRSSVELKHGRVENLPFEEEAFDLVVSTNSFHFFRRPKDSLIEMGRVIRPGGTIVITDWCDNFLACRICDRMLRLFSPAHHRIYDSHMLEGYLEETGFESIKVEKYKINWPWGLMTATAMKPVPSHTGT